MSGIRIIQAENAMLLPPGKIAALRGNTAVWIGNLGSAIEDIDADGFMFSPDDYDRLRELVHTNTPSLRDLIEQLNRLRRNG
jgi:hypothetical protein